MDKSKFTANPQLDSEGFILADAECWGCSPEEGCVRSGFCWRYNSPLRVTNPPGWQDVDGVVLPPITWGIPA
jgi:hypothetical protein